jgi:hypothetical protein
MPAMAEEGGGLLDFGKARVVFFKGHWGSGRCFKVTDQSHGFVLNVESE